MLDRTVQPPFVASSTFNLLEPEKRILPNGIPVYFVRGGKQEVLKIELLFNAGRWVEKKWGAGYFTGNLLTKGTRYKSSFQIAQLFDRYGAHVEIQAGLDVLSVSLYALTRHLQPVLLLLREVLQEPIFPRKELDQSKSIYLQNLKVNQEKTSFLASKQFRRSLFGENHPYGKELDERDVNAVDQQSLFDHFDKFLHDFAVFVAGYVDEQSSNLIEDVFAGWNVKASKEAAWPYPDVQPTKQLIEKENSVQSSIRMGKRSILRNDPDYFRAILAAHILGGYFGSRLMKNIREEKGLTYGVYATLHALRHGSYLVIGADVNKENVALTFAEIRSELRRLRTEEISTDELETARNHFIGSLQTEITTSFAHAEKLKTIYLYSLPSTYYHDMISHVQRALPVDIAEVCSRHFHEDDFFDIAVG